MRVRSAIVALLGWLAVLGCAPAAAEDCAPQTRITTLQMEPSTGRREEFVPVRIQGTRKLMLLDTGGAMTEITTEAADELHLVRRRGNFRLYNMYGEFSDHFAEGSLEVTPLRADAVALAIAPGRRLFGDDTAIAGVLAPDILKHYDVDLDFGNDTLTLFSPDHCPGKVIYWKADAVAVIPMRVLDSGHIVVPVMLDGKRVIATLDTGAYNSTLNIPIAESTFGLRLGSEDTPRAGNLVGKASAVTYRHVFSTLAFDGVAVKNLQVQIIPDLLHQVMVDAALPPTGTRIFNPRKMEADAGMLIGMNILRHFHIYIAYKEEKLYITPAVETPPDTPTADAPPPATPANFRMRAGLPLPPP
jgi:predicted aspartyl protease